MSEQKLVISPKTKVGELLESYPELEKILLELSPAFAKLKNPILRKTVARVASLQQAAVVGGLKVDELVNRLRKEAGQSADLETGTNQEYTSAVQPSWFNATKISQHLDAVPIINAGNSPMNEILQLANKLQKDEILELKAPFIPAPIIDILIKKGFQEYSVPTGDGFTTYFYKA